MMIQIVITEVVRKAHGPSRGKTALERRQTQTRIHLLHHQANIRVDIRHRQHRIIPLHLGIPNLKSDLVQGV